MTAPLVTVCIPVWNGSASIGRCLAAILDQRLMDAEILVVDNASDDSTAAIAQDILQGISGSRVVVNDSNLGRVGNWNRCLELSRGRFVKFALANDVLLKGSVETLLSAAAQYPDAVMICSRFCEVDRIPNDLPSMEKPLELIVRDSTETLRYFAEKGCRTGGLNSMLINRERHDTSAIRFRENIPYCADYIYAIELAALGPSVFLDSDSYLFNAGAASRFHFVGLERASQFFLEQRECTRLIGRHLHDSEFAHRYLYGQYHWFLGQGAKLGFRDAWATFSDAPMSMRMRATWNTLYFRIKQAVQPQEHGRELRDTSPSS